MLGLMKNCLFKSALSGLILWAMPFLFGLQVVGAGKKAKPEAQMIFDFTGDKLQERWVTVNDNVMGGCSKGDFSLKKGKLIFSGATNTNGGGFSYIRTKQADLDLDDKEGVIIGYKRGMVVLTSLTGVWGEAPLPTGQNSKPIRIQRAGRL